MINPMKLMQFKSMGDRFKANHPKIPGFVDAAMRSIQEDSIIEVTVTGPDGKKICTNMRVTADDMQMLREAQDVLGQMG